jgi:transcriptional regulator with XRE-family HTH domain
MYERGPAAERIAAARQRSGISLPEVANRLGLSPAAYDDLEAYDDEAFTSISIEQLCQLADLLGVAASSLVAPAGSPVEALEPVSLVSLASSLDAQLRERAERPETLSARLGWDVSEILSDPRSTWRVCNLDCLQDLCRSVGLSWLGVVLSWPGERAA